MRNIFVTNGKIMGAVSKVFESRLLCVFWSIWDEWRDKCLSPNVCTSLLSSFFLFIFVTYSFLCLTWPIHMCDNMRRFFCLFFGRCHMAHSCVWHDPFMRLTDWFTRTCEISHSCVWHDPFMCVIWLTDMFAITHAYVWCNSCICVTWCPIRTRLSLFIFFLFFV